MWENIELHCSDRTCDTQALFVQTCQSKLVAHMIDIWIEVSFEDTLLNLLTFSLSFQSMTCVFRFLWNPRSQLRQEDMLLDLLVLMDGCMKCVICIHIGSFTMCNQACCENLACTVMSEPSFCAILTIQPFYNCFCIICYIYFLLSSFSVHYFKTDKHWCLQNTIFLETQVEIEKEDK